MTQTRKFEIKITGSCVLDEKQIWPDGDGPEIPTAEDVLRVIATQYGNGWSVICFDRFLREWNIEKYFDVECELILERETK